MEIKHLMTVFVETLLISLLRVSVSFAQDGVHIGSINNIVLPQSGSPVTVSCPVTTTVNSVNWFMYTDETSTVNVFTGNDFDVTTAGRYYCEVTEERGVYRSNSFIVYEIGFASSFTRNPKNLTVYSDTSRYAFECQIATFVSTEVDLNLMRIEWDGAMNSSEEFQLQDSQFSFSPLPGYSIFVRDINGSSFDMLPDRFRCRAVFTLPNGAEMIVATSDMALIIQMDMIGSGLGPPDTRDFLLAPSDVVVTEMDTAVFVCVPADPSFEVMWLFDISNTVTGPNGYYISIANVEMSVTVSCMTNGNSSSATLSVQEIPVLLIDSVLSNLTLVREGSNVTLECSSLMTIPTPTIIWLANGSVVQVGTNQYTIDVADETSRGVYQCLVEATFTPTTNSVGLPPSTSFVSTTLLDTFCIPIISISVDGATSGNVDSSQYNITFGNSFNITCQLSCPTSFVTWTRDGITISNSSLDTTSINGLSVEYTTNNGGMVTSSVLLFSMASLSNTGSYQCGTTVQNIQADNKVDILVYVQTMIITPPEDQAVALGENVTFTCIASGTTPPKIMWAQIVDGNSILISNDETSEMGNTVTSTLTISDVKEADFGDYQCIASDGFSVGIANFTIAGVLRFLEFGENRKFIINSFSSDAASEPISMPFGFPFGSVIHTLAYVGTNGIISFGRPFLFWNPVPFPGGIFSSLRDIHVVAPYWSDNDIRREGTVSYEVFQLQATGAYGDRLLDEVSVYIRTSNISSDFRGNFMILAEWRGVHPYPHGASAAFDNDPFLAQTNTYQAVVITNLEESCAIFIYECGSIEWAGEFVFPTIGFNSPSVPTFVNHPLTGQSNANQIACRESNLLYQISISQSVIEEQRRMCLEWYSSDIERFTITSTSIRIIDFLTPSCPCSLFQAFFDFRYSLFTIRDNTWCYLLRFPNFQLNTDRECCYTLEFLMFGALITDPSDGGSLLVLDGTFQSYERDNFLPKSYCCSDLVGLCNLYSERRPSDNCARYRPLRRAWFWGDPHFTTLDNYTYTFNGIGEYVLLRSAGEVNVEFQGRTAVAPNSNATVFSAFAIQHEGTTVQLSIVNGEFNVSVNGDDISTQLTMTGSNVSDLTYFLQRSANNSMLVQFPSGLGLTANYSNGILSFVLNLPPTFNSSAQGLLGTFNGNISDDLIFRNGTLLPIESTDAEKHVFGQSWQITNEESIFTYDPGESVDTFSNPDHVPPFLDEIRRNLEGNSTLVGVCGNNPQCLFDVGQTGDENVGMDTLQFEEQVIEQVIMSETFPPNISASSAVFMATNGTSSTYPFMVTESASVDIIVNGQFELPPNIILTDTSDVDFVLTWNPQDVEEEVNITIVAIGSGNVTSVFSPRVQLCACTNNGTCTEAGILNIQLSFIVLNCECLPAYDGRFCEDDANGCAETSCLEGQSCIDNTAPLSGAQCTCPDGYTIIDSKCDDIDECRNNTDNCTQLQECTNTAGSFMCSCITGYRSSTTSPLFCADIDECTERRDNCDQICTNTDGSFSCSCRPGFELNPDNSTCNVTAECSQNHNCSQLCSVDPDSGLQVCSCERGYLLEDNNISCNDVNECDVSGTCSQNCTNTNGSFLCSCNAGYTLGSDERTCDDNNECLDLPCMPTFLCNNIDGSFECQCPSGTVMMNNECVVVIPTSTTETSMASPTITSSTPQPTITVDEQDDDDLSGGAIAGIVIGSVLGLVLLVILIIAIATAVFVKRHRTKTVTIATNKYAEPLPEGNVHVTAAASTATE